MHLLEAQIRNFRSIKNETVSFGTRCRILVGINESGKSNILKALRLLDPAIGFSESDRREPLQGEDPNEDAEVLFLFRPESAELDGLVTIAKREVIGRLDRILVGSGTKKWSLAKYISELREIVAQVRPGKASNRDLWVWPLEDGISISDEWYVPTSSCPSSLSIVDNDGEQILLASVKLVHQERIVGVDASFYRAATNSDFELLMDRLVAAFFKDLVPSCMYWSYDEAHLLPSHVALDGFMASPDTCLPLKQMFLLAGHQDIASAISKAKAKSPNNVRNLLKFVSSAATEHLRNVWKDYKNISIELLLNGANIDCVIKDEENWYEFSKRSDGFKRFISFLLMVSARHRSNGLVNTLYLHDEPDTGLHPSGARHLRDELIRISKENYVVFATHSIFMIDKEDIGRHLIVTKKAETTEALDVTESNIVEEEVLYNALGYSVLETLKERNIVFEGWRDKQLFEAAVRKFGAKDPELKKRLTSIGRCHARGCGDVGRITPVLELVNRKYVILGDSDKPARDFQASYQGNGAWLRYDQLIGEDELMTAEDFVERDAIISAVSLFRADSPGIPDFKAMDMPNAVGKWKFVQSWIAKEARLSGRDAKHAENAVKGLIFDHIRPAAVSDAYRQVLVGTAEALGL